MTAFSYEPIEWDEGKLFYTSDELDAEIEEMLAGPDRAFYPSYWGPNGDQPPREIWFRNAFFHLLIRQKEPYMQWGPWHLTMETIWNGENPHCFWQMTLKRKNDDRKYIWVFDRGSQNKEGMDKAIVNGHHCWRGIWPD